MKKIIKIILIMLLTSLQVTANASNYKPISWISLKVVDTIYTNYDIESWIETTQMDDSTKSSLFSKAKGDYDTYLELRAKWLKPRFENALQQIAYIKVLEKDAKREKNRIAFNITKEDYYAAVRKFEDAALKKHLATGKGIRYAADVIGKELKANHYPHKPSLTNTDLYYEWLDSHKKRIKENLRINEAKKYEFLMATEYDRELYVRPMEVHDFFKKNKKLLEDRILSQNLTSSEVEKVLVENPEVKVLLKDIQFLSLGSVSLSKYHKSSTEQFKTAKEKLVSTFIPTMNDKKVSQIIRYADITKKLADKYKNVEKLEEKSEKSLKKFISGSGDYNDLMLSRLYDMAAKLITLNDNKAISTIKEQAVNLLPEAFKWLSEEMKNDEFYLEESSENLLVEDLIANKLKDFIEKRIGVDSNRLILSFYDMAIWAIKFEAKKISLVDETKIQIEAYKYGTFEGQERVEKYLKMKTLKGLIAKFKDRKLRRRWEGLIRANTDGEYQIRGRAAYEFLIMK